MRCYALCYRSTRIVIRRATTLPNGCLTFCVASTSDMLSLARSELGKTCLWVRYSKTTRNRIDLLISLLSTTVRYLLSVWLNVERLGLYRRPMAGTCEGSDTADDTRPHYRRMGEILIWQCPSPVKLIV